MSYVGMRRTMQDTTELTTADLTDDNLRTLADNPELLVGTELDGDFGTREITDTVDVELSPWAPASLLGGQETAAGVVVEDNKFGVGSGITNQDGQAKVVTLLKKIVDGEVEVAEWSDDVRELADEDDDNDEDGEKQLATDGGEDQADALSKTDAELVYRHLPDTVKTDVKIEAHEAALDEWRSKRPADLDALEDASDDPQSAFEWTGIDIVPEQTGVDGRTELVAHTGVDPAHEELRDFATEFGWDYIDAVRREIRQMQQATNFSPREFVAFVLWQNDNLTYETAAEEMGVAEGTFAGKIGHDVKPEIESARETVRLVERFD